MSPVPLTDVAVIVYVPGLSAALVALLRMMIVTWRSPCEFDVRPLEM